jgi:hypothetical protein
VKAGAVVKALLEAMSASKIAITIHFTIDCAMFYIFRVDMYLLFESSTTEVSLM